MADMNNIKKYKCLNCTAPIEFSAKTGKLKCDFCGSSFELSDYEGNIEKEAAGDAKSAFEAQKDWATDENMQFFKCPSCAAVIMCDTQTAATTCPYCDNPLVAEKKFSGALKPEYIIPFRVQKKALPSTLSNFYDGRPLLPDLFTDKNHIEETKGVYVPFYFFDGTAKGTAIFNAQTSSTKRSGNTETTTTKYYECIRSGSVNFSKVPVDASVQMDDAMMDSIEPFHFNELKDFSTGYLPGYFADVCDVSVDECKERANTRCTATFADTMRDSVTGFSCVTKKSINSKVTYDKIHYGLLPVYILNTKFKDKNFQFAINGQTGKIVGELPIDKGKSRKHLIFDLVRYFVLGIILAYSLMMATEWNGIISLAVLFSIIFSLIHRRIEHSQMKTVAMAGSASHYATNTVFSNKEDKYLRSSTSTRTISTSSGSGSGSGSSYRGRSSGGGGRSSGGGAGGRW